MSSVLFFLHVIENVTQQNFQTHRANARQVYVKAQDLLMGSPMILCSD